MTPMLLRLRVCSRCGAGFDEAGTVCRGCGAPGPAPYGDAAANRPPSPAMPADDAPEWARRWPARDPELPRHGSLGRASAATLLGGALTLAVVLLPAGAL